MKLFTLSPIALTVTTIMSSAAMADDAKRVMDDIIVVTASGMEQKLVEAPASITVINHDDLAKKNFTNLAEALSGIEGVDIRSGTGKTGGLNISIRGMPSSYTLILVDGVRQSASSDATPNGFGSMNTGFMPPMNAIAHIEVIRGPMSTLYGSDAIGGVVNIITKKHADRWGGSVNVDQTVQTDDKWGDSSTVGFYTSGPIIKDALDLTLRGKFKHRQGSSVTSLSDSSQTRIPYPSESDNYNLAGKLIYQVNDNNSVWFEGEVARQSYNNDESQLGPVGTSGGGYEDELRYQQDKITLGHSADLDFGELKSNLLYQATENKGRVLTGRSIGNDSEFIGDPRTLKNSNLIFNSKFVAPIGDSHQVTAGVEYWHSEMEDGIVKVMRGDTFKENTFSLYGEDQWQILEDLNLTYGARYEKHESFGGHVSPRVYAVYNLSSDWTVKGGVSTGYNTPSLSQLHDGVSGIGGNGTVNNIGNPNLNPEKSTNYESGVYYENDAGFKVNATVFYNQYRDAISSLMINDITKTYQNIGEARVEGVEFATSFPIVYDTLNFDLNYTYNNTKQENGEDKGANFYGTAKHMANARLQWQVNDELSTRLVVEYHGKAPRYTSLYRNLTDTQQDIVSSLSKDLKDWTVLNLGATYHATKQITINAVINNVFDTDYSQVELFGTGRGSQYAGDYFSTSRSTSGYVNPGRNFWLSATYNF